MGWTRSSNGDTKDLNSSSDDLSDVTETVKVSRKKEAA
jgi:hypothetical protein